MNPGHTIVVDDREARSPAALALADHPEVQLRIARLSMGDFLVDGRLLVERKFLPDLLGSIEDGRLFRQAHALAQSRQPALVILEGTSAHLAGRRMRRDSIQGALLTLSLGMGLPILRAMDGQETAKLILQAADLLQREPRGWIRRPWQAQGAKRRLQSRLLQSIPGIGPGLAARLLDRFRTLQDALTAPESALEEVEGLGPIKAKRIRWLVSETPVPYRLAPPLSDFVAANVGDQGSYENVSEYIRDLIRRDLARSEAAGFERLKAELTLAFAAPEDSYRPLTASEVIARNRTAKA